MRYAAASGRSFAPNASLSEGGQMGRQKRSRVILMNHTASPLAGEEGFEPSAYGFGDRRSAN